MAARTWIVIVNYRTADLAVDCLHSVARQISELQPLHAIVVDCASDDGAAKKLVEVIDREQWNGWASVLPLDCNGGIAFGNNAGIREALQSACHVDYVMLLNPYTIVHRGAIRALVDFMDPHQRVGIAGGRFENAGGATECSAHNAPSLPGELESGACLGILSRVLHRYAESPPLRAAADECDWVSGPSLIVKRKVFEEIGVQYKEYFLYYEEGDFCLRARKASWKIWYVPESRVVHLEGASTGVRNILRRRSRYWYDFRRRFFVKYSGLHGLILADALWAVGRMSIALRRILRLGASGKAQDPKWFACDLFWGDLRSFFTRQLWKISYSELAYARERRHRCDRA